MSGHNKWSSIKHKKAAQDAKRGALFTKLIKEITIAAREGGGNPEANSRLRAAIMRAKDANMPNDNIERAIKKGTGELEGVHYEELTYEGYGPGGVALMIDVVTDNKNRTAADVRHIMSKHGGNLGENGCVSWIFERRGYIEIDGSKYSEDEVMEAVIDGALDVKSEDGSIVVVTEVGDFTNVLEALKENKIDYINAEITRIPKTTVKVDGDNAKKLLNLIDALESHDDVQKVSANFEIDDEILNKLAA